MWVIISSIGPIAGRRTSDRDRKMSEEEDCKSGISVDTVKVKIFAWGEF